MGYLLVVGTLSQENAKKHKHTKISFNFMVIPTTPMDLKRKQTGKTLKS